MKCLSDHVMIKNLPPYDSQEAKYRPRERQEVVKALCRNDRLIVLQGLYGDGKETIAKSCLRFVADRKIFSGGVIHLNLQRVRANQAFLEKMRLHLVNKLRWKKERLESIPDASQEDHFANFLINLFN